MIKNEAKITNDVEVNINRAAIEHRATWMGLIFDELRKDGIDPEPAFRRAIRRCGNFHGKGFKEACGGSNDGKNRRRIPRRAWSEDLRDGRTRSDRF